MARYQLICRTCLFKDGNAIPITSCIMTIKGYFLNGPCSQYQTEYIMFYILYKLQISIISVSQKRLKYFLLDLNLYVQCFLGKLSLIRMLNYLNYISMCNH